MPTRQPTIEDWNKALELIKKLQGQLSIQFSARGIPNQRLIQEANDLLARYGMDGPTFEG